MNEVFIDPKYILRRPNEAVLKLGFNENGELGLISSYQDIGDRTIFTGIALVDNSVWVSQAPLVLKAELDFKAVRNAAEMLQTLSPGPLPLAPQVQQNIIPFDHLPFSEETLHNIFRALGRQHNSSEYPFEDSLGKEYFGHPDFKNNDIDKKEIPFDLDQFMDAFDAGTSDDTDTSDDDTLEDPPDNFNDGEGAQ